MKAILLTIGIGLMFNLAIGQNSFSGVFRSPKKKIKYWNNASCSSFTAKQKELKKQGYQLIDIEGRAVANGKPDRFWGMSLYDIEIHDGRGISKSPSSNN